MYVYNGETELQLDISCHHNEASSTRSRLYLIELLAKKVQQELPNNPCCCQNYRLLSTNLWQGSIAEDNTYTAYWTWRSRAGSYIEPSLYVLVSDVFIKR